MSAINQNTNAAIMSKTMMMPEICAKSIVLGYL